MGVRAHLHYARGGIFLSTLTATLVVWLAGTPSAQGFCRMSTRAAAPTSAMPCVLCEEDDPSADCRYLSWRRRCMEVAVHEGGARDFRDDEVRSLVSDSLRTWLVATCGGQSSGVDVRLIDAPGRCDTAEYNTDGGNANTVIFVRDWPARGYEPSAYALTTVWHSTRTGEIFDVDMEINETRGTYGVCPDRTGCSDGTIDLPNVLTHEFGHFFGLGHSLQSVATMHAISPPGEVTKRILRTDDVDGYCAIYPPGSLPESCDFEPRGGLVLECGGEEGCSCRAVGGRRRPSIPAVAVGLLVLLALVVRRRVTQ